MKHVTSESATKAIQTLAESIRMLTKVPVVLIVDDSPDDRELIANEVTQFFSHCKIWGCEDGHQALQILNDTEVDIVFLDVRLPKIGGIEVLRQIKAVNPPIIVMVTGFGEETEQTVEAIKLGAVRVIAKPVTARDLKATLGAI